MLGEIQFSRSSWAIRIRLPHGSRMVYRRPVEDPFGTAHCDQRSWMLGQAASITRETSMLIRQPKPNDSNTDWRRRFRQKGSATLRRNRVGHVLNTCNAQP